MKKILIFSNGEKIGDGIIKLPFIRDIHHNFSDYELTWLTYGNTVYNSVLSDICSQYIDKVISKHFLNIFS